MMSADILHDHPAERAALWNYLVVPQARTSARQNLIESLLTDDSQTWRELAEDVSLGLQQVRSHMLELEQAGVVDVERTECEKSRVSLRNEDVSELAESILRASRS